MEQVTLDRFSVIGLSARTKNSDEMDPKRAKIGKLWQEFQNRLTRQDIQPVTVYGVYSNYASNQHDGYDVTVATRENFLDSGTIITIPAGKYQKFTKSGPCPETTIALWQEIEDFFSLATAPRRTFLFDFEEYSNEKSVSIFIGIEEGSCIL
jgi:predicted transcriptional regulator YdeE